MKKNIVLFLAFALLMPVVSYAASISGAETTLGASKETPRFFSLKRLAIGVDNDWVFNRDLKVSSYAKYLDTTSLINLGGVNFPIRQISYTSIDNTYTKPKIDRMYLTTAKISYALFKNLDIFIKLGRANLKLKDESFTGRVNDLINYTQFGVAITPAMPIDNGNIDYDIDNSFVWGVGFKATYDLPKNWSVGMDAQYLRHKHDYDASSSIMFFGGGVGFGEDYETYSGTLTIYEWQIAPYIAKKIKNFTPYLGFKYSDLRIKDHSQVGFKYLFFSAPFVTPQVDVGSGNYTIKKYRTEDNFGPFVGLDYNITKNLKLNIEGRFVDETAMSCNISYKF
ncbi:MAG: hypothetical protein AB1472_06365 [Candidatus Omnitrophota bacterium]